MRRTKPPKIAIRNRQRILRLDPAAVRRLIREACNIQHPASSIQHLELSVAFVTDAEIARLNGQFLGHAGPTDVITFEHGEIVISTEHAMAQAKRFHTTVADELALYLVHGLLHLNGYDDLKPVARKVMHRRQRQLLATLRMSLDLQTLLR